MAGRAALSASDSRFILLVLDLRMIPGWAFSLPLIQTSRRSMNMIKKFETKVLFKSGAVLLMLACWQGAGGLLWADDPVLQSDKSTGLQLLKQGDTLADEGKTNEAEILYQQAMEQLLPGIRHLPFKTTVKRDVTPRDKIRDVMLKEIAEDQSDEEFRADELAMKAFGLLPADLDYKETLLKLLTEQIGAFYDPQTDTMHLILEPEEKTKKKPGFFAKLFGATGGFDKDNSKTIIAHELTHALADQHYDLHALTKSISHDDDREMALSSLIEGEATLAMMAAQGKDWDGKSTAELPSDSLAQTIGMMAPMLRIAGGAQIAAAPPIMSEPLVFPYLQGMVFCARLTNAQGWPGLDGAYRNPPISTEQILHPEKYRDQPDPPTEVDMGTLPVLADWTRNVLGEMGIGILLRNQKGKIAAAGWDGDRFALFEGPAGKLGLVWRSTWDTEGDAREFFTAYAKYQESRFGGPAPGEGQMVTRREKDGANYLVELRGRDVVVVEGFDASGTQSLGEAAWNAKLSDKLPLPSE